MAEKAGVAHPYWIICELCELCEQMPSVYFLRKVSMFSGKLRTRKSAQYKPPGSLIEAIANAAAKRGSQGGQSDGDSIFCQWTIRESQQTAAISNISNSRCNTAKAAKRNTSGIQAEYKRQQLILLPIRSASSGVLFVGCWYYLQKSERFTSPTALITIKSAQSGRIAHSVFGRSAALFLQKVHKVHKVHTF